MSERFRAADIDYFDVGSGKHLIYCRNSMQSALLDAEDVEVLHQCGAYRSLDEHAANFARRAELGPAMQLLARGPGFLARAVRKSADSYRPNAEKTSQTRSRLTRLAEQGFMTRLSEFRQIQAEVGGPPPGPIRTVGMTTRNRPMALERAIRSYVQNAREFGRTTGFTIIDDSLNERDESACRELLVGLGRETRAVIRFGGRGDRERYAEALAQEAGVDVALTRFALLGDPRFPVTTGSARNALLMDTVGENYILADDDGVCSVAACPGKADGLSVSTNPSPLDFWFYRDREETLRETTFEAADLAKLHEAMLGREAGELVRACPESDLKLDEMSARFERCLRRGGARVRATMAGIVGDSGIGSTAYLYLSPSSTKRLLQSPDFYRQAVASRQVLRAPSRATIGSGGACMAGNLGVDNVKLLPPFSPVQRNSDGLFARLLAECFPCSAMGYLPWAVLHDPLERREQSVDEWLQDVRRMRHGEIVGAAIALAAEFDPEIPADLAMERLGRRMREAASGPLTEFFEGIRLQTLSSHAKRLQLAATADDGSLPDFYRNLRRKQSETERQAMTQPSYWAARDLLAAGYDEDDARRLSREAVELFGRLIESWAEIRSAAVRLRERGVRLTAVAV